MEGPTTVQDVVAALHAGREQPAPVPAPEIPEQAEPAPVEQPEGLLSEGGSPEPEAVEEAAPEEVGEPVVYLSDLADVLEEVDADYLYGLKVKVEKTPGEHTEMTIEEVKDLVGEAGIVARDRDAVAAEKVSYVEERQSFNQHAQARMAELSALVDTVTRELLPADLQQTDPATYLMRERQLQGLQAQVQQHVQAVEGERLQARQRHMEREGQKLRGMFPDLEPAALDAELQQANQSLLAFGVPSHVINDIVDAPVAAIAIYAARYLNQQKEVATAKKKVAGLPKKVLKPGRSQGATTTAQRTLAERREKLSQAGASIDDVVRLRQARRAAAQR